MTKPHPAPAGPVVVGFDGSTAAARAVDVAVDQASRRGARLVVLAIAAGPTFWSDSVEELYGDAPAGMDRARSTAAAGVSRASRRCPDVPVDVVVSPEPDSAAIDALAARAQLLVLGARGPSDRRCLSAGATSSALARAFGCSILIAAVPRLAAPPGNAVVVAGVDGRESSAAVLRAADTECRLRESDLVAVHAYGEASAPPRHLSEVCWRLFGQSVADRRGATHQSDRLVFTRGMPVDVLTARARAGDLLVLGTHARGRVRATDPATVVRQVLDRATCDVLLVPSAPA